MNNMDINFIFNYFKEFGIIFSSKYFYYAGLKFYSKRQNLVNNYLENEYKSCISSFNYGKEESIIKPQNFKIWVFWWQGINDMPPIVKLCYRSLKYHAKEFEICLLTKNNIKEYVRFPDFIWKKFYNKNFSVTHFSDLVRFYLLNEYGGLWIDATVFLTDDLVKYSYIFNSNFFTPKISQKDDKSFNVAKERWCGFLMGSNHKHNIMFEYGINLFYKYWLKYGKLIDYFLIDYIINYMYTNNKDIRKMINNNKINNTFIFHLNKQMNETYNESVYEKIVLNTIFHKLSWKKDIDYKNKRNFYNHLNKVV